MTSSDKIIQMSRTLHSAEILETEKGIFFYKKKARMWILLYVVRGACAKLSVAGSPRMAGVDSIVSNQCGARIARSPETGPFGFPLFADPRSFRAGSPYTYSVSRYC